MESCLSLTTLYKHLCSSDTTSLTALHRRIYELPSSQVDSLLKSWAHYHSTSQSRWPFHRLLRCLEVLLRFINRKNQKTFHLPSLAQCLKQTAQLTHSPPVFIITQALLPCLALLLEHYTALVKPAQCLAAVDHVLEWSLSIKSDNTLQRLCLRALSKPSWSVWLLRCNAYVLLTKQLYAVQDKTEHLTLVSCLLEHLVKLGRERTGECSVFLSQYAHTIHFHVLASVWESLCKRHQPSSKEIRSLHSLTATVNVCISVSDTALNRIAESTSVEQWHPLVYQLMRDVLVSSSALRQHLYENSTQPFTKDTPHRKDMDLAASLLGRLLQCSIKTCSGESSQCHSLDVRTIVHCLVVYVAWPTKAEDIAHVEKGHWPSQVWVDSEEQAFCYLEARVVLAYESLFALLLECLIQTIQNTSDATVNRLARSTAVCVQALWTCLLKETAPVSLSGRLEKLGVYLLHYSDAVDQWSNAPSHLQSLVWQPTLVQAKQGLALICHSSPKEMLPAGHPYVSEKETPQHTPLHASLLSKAKRAFAALEKASHHPRACERLVDEDCLSLVSMAWIPTNTQLGYSVETLTVYSLFIRFIASLVSKTAYVRIKLREECTVIPMILHLLDLSTKARESDSLKRQQWNRVIVWSLKVIHAFQFDMASLQAWITWKGLNDREILVSVDQALTSSPHQGSLYNKEGSTNSLLSILRDVLILTPSTVSDKEEEIWKRDEQVMTTATLLLDTLTLLPEFGLQIMESDPPMMESLGKLLLLMTQVSSCPLPLSLIDTTETCTTSLVSLQALQRSLTRLVTYKETLSVFVRLDLWMLLFRPTLLHRPMDIYWRDYFCQQLHTKCLEDLWRLFQFTLNDNAIVLNEMCAIAIAYACMDPQHWSLLVDVATEENILDENCIMGVVCHMLVYSLESTHTPPQAYLLTRRRSSAQVIEIMAHQKRHALALLNTATDIITNTATDITTNTATVVFITDDRQTITVEADPLIQQSSSFAALLSNTYQESQKTPIHLHDVSFQGISHLLHLLSHLLHRPSSPSNSLLPTHSDACAWSHVIELLQLSDRYGCPTAFRVCEQWILEQLHHPSFPDTLQGSLLVFRKCRDPSTHNGGVISHVWPFQHVMKSCLYTMALYCTRLVTLPLFCTMVEEGDGEEVNTFCHAIVTVLMSSRGTF